MLGASGWTHRRNAARTVFRASQRLLATLAAAALAVGCGGDPEPEVRVYIAGNEDLGIVEALGLDVGDSVNLLIVATVDGQPMSDQRISVESEQDNLITHPMPRTDSDGKAGTRLLAQHDGFDRITFTTIDGTTTELQLRVSDTDHDLHADGESGPLKERDDVVAWETLRELETFEEDDMLAAKFPERVQALDGETVRLQGFMMPLDAGARQEHFLLTRSTPSCFYCVPGGPESTVEIIAEKGLEFTFEPMVLEGRFELMEPNEMGIFYRLVDARLVD